MPKKKLKEIDIRAIFYYSQKGFSGTEIAKFFSITKSQISRILNGNRWNKVIRKLFPK